MTDTASIDQEETARKPSKWNTVDKVLATLTALMVLATAVLTFLKVESDNAADEADNRAADLSSQVEELQQSVESLTQENNDLAGQVASLQEENTQLRSQATGSDGAGGLEDMVIENVRVEPGDFKQVAPGEYELNGSDTLDFRFGWTTIANTGQLDSTDCTVVATVRSLVDDSIFDVQRSRTCSLGGWIGEALPAGEYLITVEVEAVNGAEGTGQTTISVLP
jgi:FtsZ-binding cell division protein ZapB